MAAKEKNIEYINSNFSKIKMESLTVKNIIKKY